jgi:hypothetical protein
MSTLMKAAVAVGAIVVSASSAAMAGSDARFVSKRISNGPRPDQYMMVRVDRPARADRPYALTGNDSERRMYRASLRSAPLHPKGPQSAY